MVEVAAGNSATTAGALANRRRPTIWWLVAIVSAVVATFVGLAPLAAPPVAPSSVPAEQFSAERALEHLERIAREPRPMGSPAHLEVRGYLVKQLTAAGLAAEIQSETVMVSSESGLTVAARIHNVLARLPGTREGSAVLLAAHYDTVPNSPGAADDGAGVAALLETARGLAAGPPLRNDVLFLFTDGEEKGRFGARAFADRHPAAEQVGVVLNFEARGASGPSLMFETTAENGWLASALADAPWPVGFSFMSEIYQRLDRPTDFLIFKQAGMAGMSFAFVDDLTAYHTRLDTADRLDLRSLQHHGSYAMALGRHFGGFDFENPRPSSSAVYFNVPGLGLLVYSVAWVRPLSIGLGLALLGLCFYGWRQRRLTVKGMAWALGVCGGGCVAAGGVGFLLQQLIAALDAAYWQAPWSARPGAWLYALATVLLVVAALAVLYRVAAHRVSPADLVAGSLLAWLAGVAFVWRAPGISYLLTWPLLVGSLVLAALLLGSRQRRPPVLVLLAVVLTAVLWAPLALTLFWAVGLISLVGLAVVVAWPLCLVLAQLGVPSRAGTALAAVAGLSGLACLVVPTLMAPAVGVSPVTNSILYAADRDREVASWMTVEDELDEWTQQFLGTGPEWRSWASFFPFEEAEVLQAEAPWMELEGSQVLLEEEEANATGRILRLKVQPSPKAFVNWIYLRSPSPIEAVWLEGDPIEMPEVAEVAWQVGIEHHAARRGFELRIQLSDAANIELSAIEAQLGLPEPLTKDFATRSREMIPSPYIWYTDATLVRQGFEF